jgi:hypothetical protein
MSAVPVSEIFDVEYGNKLNFNAMEEDEGGVNFVSRSRMRLGVVARVKKLASVEPYPSGLITVTLGGSYLLSTFVQPNEFYTAQNVKVLSPKGKMSFREKVYYCACIAHNRHRYSSHGREANRSLDSLLVPARSDVPTWVSTTEPHGLKLTADQFVAGGSPSEADNGEVVRLDSLFDLYNGINPPAHARTMEAVDDEHLPLVRPSKSQFSSFSEYVARSSVDARHVYPSGTLYISTNGQGSHTYAYVSPFSFVPNSDVTVAVPKSPISLAEKLFYAMAITRNRPLFSYGRKPKGSRLAEVLVPANVPAYVRSEETFQTILAQQV